MTPDIELQLQVIIKSLKDNVAPGIDQNNQLAQEQMHLSLAALQFTLDHLPYVHSYLRRDIENTIGLTEKLVDIVADSSSKGELSSALAHASDALNNPQNGFTELQQVSRALRDTASKVIRVESEGENALLVHSLVLRESADSLNMGRSWNKPNGFEPEPDTVADFQQLLS